jgi:hypothetical protein
MSHHQRAYALREAYRENFSGGTSAYGPSALTIDLKAALEANEGVIVTDDPHLAHLLETHDAFEACQLPDEPTLAEIPTADQVAEQADGGLIPEAVPAPEAPAPSPEPVEAAPDAGETTTTTPTTAPPDPDAGEGETSPPDPDGESSDEGSASNPPEPDDGDGSKTDESASARPRVGRERS